ncbi:TPA: hypothetical protein ACTW1K_002338 [Raoultella planticola]
MKRLFIKHNKYKDIDRLINDGDLVFGIALIIKEIQVHLLQKKMRNNSYIIQADLTNDVWSYADTSYTIKKRNPRTEGFYHHIKNHDRYNVAYLFLKNSFKDRINVFKKTSKCGLEYQLIVQKQRVHFFLDGLDLLAIANKSDGIGRSVTASELRWLYRHRHLIEVKNNLFFWRDYKIISQGDFFSLPHWASYKPSTIY